MIYVYAITDPRCDAPQPAPDPLGLEGQPVRSRPAGGVAAVYSVIASHAEPSADNLWQHEAVVESVMRRCDAMLPVRFGMTFHEAALADVLARHGASLAAGLDRVRGCVEMGVRVMPRETIRTEQLVAAASSPAGQSGRAYMLARLDDERRRRAAQLRAAEVGELMDVALSPLTRDGTRRVLPAPGVLLTAAYLVPRDAAEAFASRARAWSAEHPDLRIACTGPWPPYHFAPALSRGAAEVAHG